MEGKWYYTKLEIVYKNKNNIIFENKGDGYIVNVANVDRFEVGAKCKIFLYEYNTEFYKNIYGFKDFKERLLFTDLITIDKIGPRVAMIILEKGWELVANYIINDSWRELSKINFVSEKTAKFICVELKNKWTKLIDNNAKKDSKDLNNISELSSTLSTLGFKKNQIDFAIKNVKEQKDLDKMIEESISLIANKDATYRT
ncbi:Holliday junction branch migration protein RuvA [Mycoplasmopsis cynos]|uniref:Holliday junction branch migration protein RuvA n=1 Tax=Mycoplasmopsis cynos TaxID=171284 RepID=UPI00220B331D|nr:Holliday junction branch migration protein RuvA [Mycoplasmopsis cynos]UWV81792.1 Holliday junction branch migration protein RuvA [Mycoplasmopsis cynos]